MLKFGDGKVFIVEHYQVDKNLKNYITVSEHKEIATCWITS